MFRGRVISTMNVEGIQNESTTPPLFPTPEVCTNTGDYKTGRNALTSSNGRQSKKAPSAGGVGLGTKAAKGTDRRKKREDPYSALMLTGPEVGPGHIAAVSVECRA